MTLWGELALDGARRTVSVEREYPTTQADLWEARTRPDRLAQWIGRYSTTADGFRMEMGGTGAESVVTGRVLECEPGRRIVVSWRFSTSGGPGGAEEVEAETELEVTVTPSGDGQAVLTLTHRRVQAVTASVYGAGWQDVLTHLARSLGAEATPQEHDGYLGEAAEPAAFDSALDEYRRQEAGLVAATIERSGDRSAIALERLLDADVSEVWDALTLPDRVGRWLWPVVEWPDDPVRERRLRAGDVMRLGDENVDGAVQELEVIELHERAHLRFSWGDAAVSIRLTETGDGTLLSLVQDGVKDTFGAGRLRSAPDFAAGWHTLIDQLTLLLAGLTVPARERLWEAAYVVYGR